MGVLIIVGVALLVAISSALHQEDLKPSARMTTTRFKVLLFVDFVFAAFMTWALPNTTILYAIGVFGLVATYDVSRWLGARYYNNKENINQEQ